MSIRLFLAGFDLEKSATSTTVAAVPLVPTDTSDFEVRDVKWLVKYLDSSLLTEEASAADVT